MLVFVGLIHDTNTKRIKRVVSITERDFQTARIRIMKVLKHNEYLASVLEPTEIKPNEAK